MSVYLGTAVDWFPMKCFAWVKGEQWDRWILWQPFINSLTGSPALEIIITSGLQVIQLIEESSEVYIDEHWVSHSFVNNCDIKDKDFFWELKLIVDTLGSLCLSYKCLKNESVSLSEVNCGVLVGLSFWVVKIFYLIHLSGSELSFSSHPFSWIAVEFIILDSM